ncbi:MAG: IS21-like element helper ATPase IstB [Dehalococcoidia bacterium]|jgi:DNA replication protein DnaC|nr:IS21-like element helper ATPase IstB [Dehalococcoidia bacterium]|tara:strand:- start:56 stop:784 length:729 start_codon:yes stop_codon:yes gene_type:complete
MLDEQTLATLNALKLFGMAQGFTQRLSSPQHSELSHAEFVGFLVQDEKTYRENHRLKRLLHNARLRQQAAMEDLDYKHPRGLNRQVMLELSTTQWISNHRSVLLCGPTGVGKSYIACALGNLAARGGYSVLYLRAPRLFETLGQARADGSHLKTLTKLAKVQLLILDDLLLTPMSDLERKDLLEIVEDRYGSAPIVVTSQCPIKHWHQQIGDPTLADAICDRLLHNCYKIELKGDSIRKSKK